MANHLPRDKQLLCLKMLTEGCSIRGTERTAQVNRGTIMWLSLRFGQRCQEFLDRNVRDVNAQHLEIDEQWCWVRKKQRTAEEHAIGDIGDQFLFLALDQKTGLIACHDIGKRTTARLSRLHVARRWSVRADIQQPA